MMRNSVYFIFCSLLILGCSSSQQQRTDYLDIVFLESDSFFEIADSDDSCHLKNAVTYMSVSGSCEIAECNENYYDFNNESNDGCEKECWVTNNGFEACDFIDNDCDGIIDNNCSFVNNPNYNPITGSKTIPAVVCETVLDCSEKYFDPGFDQYPNCEECKMVVCLASFCTLVDADYDQDGHTPTVCGRIYDDDCDDFDHDSHPDNDEEWCDAKDNNCNGLIDEGCDLKDIVNCDDQDPCTRDVPIDGHCEYYNICDVDQDGQDSIEVGGLDCDDDDPTVGFDFEEICFDGVDNNCDGFIDEDCN